MFCGCKETPSIKISLMDGNEVQFVLKNDYVKNFEYNYGTDANYLYLELTVMDPMDYTILISKPYEKYIVESQANWRRMDNGEDELIEAPARLFHHFSIYNKLCNEKPTIWELEFWNEEED